MKTVEIEAILDGNVDKVFDIVTNNHDFRWRSHVENLICMDDNNFIEYYKKGGSTQFIITKKRKNREYAYDMINPAFEGEWLGKFYPQENGKTKLVLIAFIDVKNPILRILSTFIKHPKKIQRQYIADLQKKVAQ